MVEHPDHVCRHADHHGSCRAGSGGEAVLGSPVRLAEHDECRAMAHAVQAHPADALSQRRHRQDAIDVGDAEAGGKALEGHLLEAGGQRGELGHSGGARGHGDLDDPRGINLERQFIAIELARPDGFRVGIGKCRGHRIRSECFWKHAY